MGRELTLALTGFIVRNAPIIRHSTADSRIPEVAVRSGSGKTTAIGRKRPFTLPSAKQREGSLRKSAAGRWLVAIILIGPLLAVHVIHLAALLLSGPSTAQYYLMGGYEGLVRWGDLSEFANIIRAVILLTLFGIWAAALLGWRSSRLAGSSLPQFPYLAFAGWLVLLLV